MSVHGIADDLTSLNVVHLLFDAVCIMCFKYILFSAATAAIRLCPTIQICIPHFVCCALCRRVPYLSQQSRVVERQSSLCIRELEAVGRCLNALFKNEVMEARKYIPRVSQYLKQSHIREALVPELVSRLLKYKACMGHEQYDILARIVNTALLHEDIATRLVPLVTVFYRVSLLTVPGFKSYMS